MSFVDRFLTPNPATVANPLVATDPAFLARCAEERSRYAAQVDEWRRSVGDDPYFTTDPVECRYAMAHTCARVCGALVEPRWSRWDVNVLAEYLPAALACPKFRDLIVGRLTRLVLAVQDGRRVLTPAQHKIG